MRGRRKERNEGKMKGIEREGRRGIEKYKKKNIENGNVEINRNKLINTQK
jgi:hypothetical protein